MSNLLRIGALAARAGVSTRTVDYYTRLGLLKTVERTGGGFRLYDPTAVDTISTVKRLEEHGLSLRTIAAAFDGAGDTDLTERLDDLAAGLQALRHAAGSAPQARALLTLVSGRAQALLDLALAIIDLTASAASSTRTTTRPDLPE